jgi:phosphatidylinositol-3-phosphatase
VSGLLRRFEARIAAIGLPSRPVSAALVFVFLAFGTVIGRVTRAPAAREASRPIVEVQAPASGAQGAKPPKIAESTPTPSEEESKGEEVESPPEASSESSAESSAKSKSSQGGGGKEHPAGSGSKAGSKAPAKLPAIKHVFLIVLDDAAYAEVFGPESKSHYLASTLESKGTLLERYYAIAHQQLANGIALVSGQGPTEQTAGDCPTYAEISPASKAASGQVTGSGCVYPPSTKTIASQLTARKLRWKAYVQGIGDGGSQASSACARPQLGAADPTSAFGLPGAATPAAGQISATFRNPFVYFRSVTGSPSCTTDDVGIERLRHDLQHASKTPNLSYIAPDLCDDGRAVPCAPGRADGMTAAEGFLREVVPEILASKAYRRNGLLVITVDEAPTTGEYADSSSCCSQPSFPNLHSTSGTGSGGGEVGALLLSPFVKGGKISQDTYDHFSLLRTIEDFFGLSHLGYAGAAGVESFSPSLFSGR